MAASVRQKLLNKSKETNRPFDEVAQFYAMERFLYRLSVSSHSRNFILKGALMLFAWNSPAVRPTKDIDLLGFLENDLEVVKKAIGEICNTPVDDDGLAFDVSTLSADYITFDAEYKGIRVKFYYKLETARYKMQIDIGFGDKVFPKPVKFEFPVILDFPAPKILGYKPETSIAEKTHAMLTMGITNSRVKDFYDIWLLARTRNFQGAILKESIRQTLGNRSTLISDKISAFSERFISESKPHWNAFKKKMKIEEIPEEFKPVNESVRAFLEPVLDAVRSGSEFTKTWTAPGPWSFRPGVRS